MCSLFHLCILKYSHTLRLASNTTTTVKPSWYRPVPTTLLLCSPNCFRFLSLIWVLLSSLLKLYVLQGECYNFWHVPHPPSTYNPKSSLIDPTCGAALEIAHFPSVLLKWKPSPGSLTLQYFFTEFLISIPKFLYFISASQQKLSSLIWI